MAEEKNQGAKWGGEATYHTRSRSRACAAPDSAYSYRKAPASTVRTTAPSPWRSNPPGAVKNTMGLKPCHLLQPYRKMLPPPPSTRTCNRSTIQQPTHPAPEQITLNKNSHIHTLTLHLHLYPEQSTTKYKTPSPPRTSHHSLQRSSRRSPLPRKHTTITTSASNHSPAFPLTPEKKSSYQRINEIPRQCTRAQFSTPLHFISRLLHSHPATKPGATYLAGKLATRHSRIRRRRRE